MEDKYGHKYERRKDLTLHRRKATYHLNICNDIIGVEGNLVLCHGLVVIQGNGRDASTSSLLLEKIRITWNKFHWRSILIPHHRQTPLEEGRICWLPAPPAPPAASCPSPPPAASCPSPPPAASCPSPQPPASAAPPAASASPGADM